MKPIDFIIDDTSMLYSLKEVDKESYYKEDFLNNAESFANKIFLDVLSKSNEKFKMFYAFYSQVKQELNEPNCPEIYKLLNNLILNENIVIDYQKLIIESNPEKLLKIYLMFQYRCNKILDKNIIFKIIDNRKEKDLSYLINLFGTDFVFFTDSTLLKLFNNDFIKNKYPELFSEFLTIHYFQDHLMYYYNSETEESTYKKYEQVYIDFFDNLNDTEFNLAINHLSKEMRIDLLNYFNGKIKRTIKINKFRKLIFKIFH